MSDLVNVVSDHCLFDINIIEIGDIVYFQGMGPDEQWSVVDIFTGATKKILRLRTMRANGKSGQTFIPVTEVYSLWRWQ